MKFKEHFPEFDKAEISISKRDKYGKFTGKMLSGYAIKVSQMYEYVDASFVILKRMSDLFGTEDIDIDEDYSEGCETCDYGSSYSKIFIVYNITKNENLLK